MTLEEKKKRIIEAANAAADIRREAGRFIFDHPELGNEEFVSSAYLAEQAEKLGLEVTYPYAGVKTALRADLRNGEGPTVALLAEYDALPGYGPEGKDNAHACGHNWIAATCLGVCAVLSQCRDLFHGTLSLIGAPAEETTGGKIDVIKGHGYDDIDAAMQFHLGAGSTVQDVHFLAMDSVEFTFHGRSAHAAAFPEQGINALDAVLLTYQGINCLRQHVTPDVRIHGIVTEGGKACNTVPDLGQCRFYVRAAKRPTVDLVREKVINVARGAALMTGCTLEWRYFENSFDDLIEYPLLQALMRANLDTLGIRVQKHEEKGAPGSSDVGNVSQLCPTCYVELETGMDDTVTAHSPEFLQVVVGPLAERSMYIATTAMAMTALDIFEDPSVLG